MKILFTALFLCLTALTAVAQSDPSAGTADDRDFLTAFLEDNLSGADRKVQITGFAGALSSRSTFDRLAVSDTDGEWLIISGGVISWNRTALLRGRVEIGELSAREIEIRRSPVGEGTKAEASGFALPELPVSVSIDAVRADRLILGEALLGTRTVVALSGDLVLGGGEGSVHLNAERIDGRKGVFSLSGAYSNTTGNLAIDILGNEGADGIAAALIDLPGRPAVEFALHGNGPLNNFTADVALSTDGTSRLTGAIEVTEPDDAPGDRRFSAQFKGDLAPMFHPDYREFFDTTTTLEVEGRRDATGALDLSRFVLESTGIDLSGRLSLGADTMPLSANLTARIGLASGIPVLLPVPGEKTQVRASVVTLRYDAAKGDRWSLLGSLHGLQRGALRVEGVDLDGSGSVTGGQGAGRLDGAIDFAATGVLPEDAALANALGSDLSGQLAFGWHKGGFLDLSSIALQGGGFDANGQLKISTGDNGPEASGKISASIADVSRYTGLAGRSLSGAASFDVSGTVGFLSGIFDIVADVSGVDLTLDQVELDNLLAGGSAIHASVRRDMGGLHIQDLKAVLETAEISATGDIGSAGSVVEMTADLDDLSVLGPAYGGSISAKARVEGPPEALVVNMTANAADLSVGIAEADRILAGSTSVSLSAERRNGRNWLNTLSLTNSNLTVRADGTSGTDERRLKIEMRLRDLALLTPGFPGPLTVDGNIVEVSDGYRISLNASGPGATKASVNGDISGAFDRADLGVVGSLQSGVFNPFIAPRRIDGPVQFDMRLAGPLALGSVSGTIGATGLRVVAPNYGIELIDTSFSSKIANGRANLNAASSVKGGGRLELSGPVDLTAPFDGDLTLQLRSVRLKDNKLYDTSASGTIRLAGPLAGGATASGEIGFADTEIRIAATGQGARPDLPGLVHLNEPDRVRQTRRNAGLIAEDENNGRNRSVYGLDIRLNVPSRLFVRGRGLDAELGGTIRITGTTENTIPVGQFKLIRGRLDILGKRFTLDEGLVQLQGALIPYVRFAASTDSSDITATVLIEGDASAPLVSFQSTPELPQEEVIAHLLFGRSLTSLSPLQAAQLASAIATLAGKGGEGIIGRLRSGFGLDDLDVTTDSNGTAGLRAGKYLSEKIYSDLTIGGDGKSQINLNIDVRPDLTVRGTLGSDGSTGVGVYYERDY